MYTVLSFTKFAEVDNFEKGCNLDSGTSFSIDVSFSDKSIDGLLERVANYFNVEINDIEKNCCDENGRIEFQVMENGRGETANENELNEWKKGNIMLWSAVYTGYVQTLQPTKI